MKNLRVLFLFVLSVTVLSCENPFFKALLDKEDSVKPSLSTAGQENTQTPLEPPPVPPPLEPDMFSFKTENTSVTLKVQTSDNSALKVEGASITSIQGNGSAQTISGITAGSLVTVKAEEGVKITKLWCHNNKLSSLNVQGLSSLQELSCGVNQLSSLNVQGCSSLQRLYCDHNQLSSLNVQGLTALEKLGCTNNQLSSLNVQGLSSLWHLSCYDNQLSSLNVQGLSSLQYLSCYDNKLSSLNVQGCSSLQALGCWNNKLNADAFIILFNGLPERTGVVAGGCYLYSNDSGENNHNNFNSPPELKTAFEAAKAKNWKMYKYYIGNNYTEI